MRPVDRIPLPTFRKLDDLGADAFAYLDALIWEVEVGIPMAASKADKLGLVSYLKKLERHRAAYASGESA